MQVQDAESVIEALEDQFDNAKQRFHQENQRLRQIVEAQAKELEAQAQRLEALKAKPMKPRLAIGKNKTLCVCGLNRFPVSLYADQWMKIVEMIPDITKFIETHHEELIWRS